MGACLGLAHTLLSLAQVLHHRCLTVSTFLRGHKTAWRAGREPHGGFSVCSSIFKIPTSSSMCSGLTCDDIYLKGWPVSLSRDDVTLCHLSKCFLRSDCVPAPEIWWLCPSTCQVSSDCVPAPASWRGQSRGKSGSFLLALSLVRGEPCPSQMAAVRRSECNIVR